MCELLHPNVDKLALYTRRCRAKLNQTGSHCVSFQNGGIQLSWYPVIRDSICWFIALIVLIVVTYDSVVQW